MTTRILELADALGRSVSLGALARNAVGAADKAFDSGAIIAELNERGTQAFERIRLRADKTDQKASMILLASAITNSR